MTNEFPSRQSFEHLTSLEGLEDASLLQDDTVDWVIVEMFNAS
jgi:hypothetical protein